MKGLLYLLGGVAITFITIIFVLSWLSPFYSDINIKLLHRDKIDKFRLSVISIATFIIIYIFICIK